MSFCNKQLLRRVTNELLQRATSAMSNERSLQRVTSDLLQRTISATSNEQSLQRVTSDFLQRATSATSNERILQRVTSDFQWVTSNEWKVTARCWVLEIEILYKQNLNNSIEHRIYT